MIENSEKDLELIHELLQLNKSSEKPLVHFIFIAKKLETLKELGKELYSELSKNNISLNLYTDQQLERIISSYVEEAIKLDLIDFELINLIVRKVSGNSASALKLLKLVIEQAYKEKSIKIKINHFLKIEESF